MLIIIVNNYKIFLTKIYPKSIYSIHDIGYTLDIDYSVILNRLL